MNENNLKRVELSELIPYLQANLEEDHDFVLPEGGYNVKIRTHKDNVATMHTMNDEIEVHYIKSSDHSILEMQARGGGITSEARAWFNRDQLAEATYGSHWNEVVSIPLHDDLTLRIEKLRR